MQQEYSWHKVQWEELFQDLIEADGAHFLGTIITSTRRWMRFPAVCWNSLTASSG